MASDHELRFQKLKIESMWHCKYSREMILDPFHLAFGYLRIGSTCNLTIFFLNPYENNTMLPNISTK